MDKVSFFEMEDGTREDYRFLSRLEREYVEKTADRVLAFMARMTSTLEGYHVSRLEHSLQTATRALHDDAGDETSVNRKSSTSAFNRCRFHRLDRHVGRDTDERRRGLR